MAEMNKALVTEHGPDINITHGTKKEIWYAFIILTILTIGELAIVFMEKYEVIPKSGFVVSLILALTVMKAYYIMAYFMHVKHEKLNFVYSILLPFVFLIYLLILLSYESFHLY